MRSLCRDKGWNITCWSKKGLKRLVIWIGLQRKVPVKKLTFWTIGREVITVNVLSNVRNISSFHFVELPYYSGSTQLSAVPEMSGAFCQYIPLPSSYFNTFSNINVILTTQWSEHNITSSHGNKASATWSEDVTRQGFRACAVVAGRSVLNRGEWSERESQSFIH